MFLKHDLLGPFEGMGGLIIGGDKASMWARSCSVLWKLAVRTAWRLSRLNQISTWFSQEAWGGRVMKMHLWMARPPAVAFGFVDIEVVEDDVQGASSQCFPQE